MELLIPGLILVALMVYASTKIKKSAARAYEPELIETDEFFILKPEGFINPLNDERKFAFIAYSKEFGMGAAENIRQASARIRVFDDADFDVICERVKQSVTNIISEMPTVSGGSQTCLIEARGEENGVPIEKYYKIVSGDSKIYNLEISVLLEHKHDYLRRIKDMVESFAVK
ncbi:MAG: hypothetical protein ACR2M8_10295 [Pyrinomonadaceae bacterium]